MQRWEVARGARAFAETVRQRQRLPKDDHVVIDFQTRVESKKRAAFTKLKNVQRAGAGFLPAKVPPLVRRLMVMGADGLAKADRFSGSSDPYAVVFWEGERLCQTPVVPSELSPRWGFPVPLEIAAEAGGGSVRVEVYDQDMSATHDFLGQVELPLQLLPDETAEAGGQMVFPAQAQPLSKGAHTEADVSGTLTLRLDDPAQDTLRELVIVDAVGLRNADRLGSSDPYAVVLWDGRRIGETHVVSDSLSPKWEVGIALSVPPCGGTATVEVYDHDPGGGGHDFLGQAELTIGPEGAARGTPANPLVMKNTMFALTPGNRRKVKVKGKVHLMVVDPEKEPAPVRRRIVLEGAEHLKNADLLGRSDPYAKVWWNGELIGQTSVVDDTLDPQWPEPHNSFEVMVPGRGGALRVAILDQDVMDSDDLLCTVELRVGGPDGLGGPTALALTERYGLRDQKGKEALGPTGRSKLNLRIEHAQVLRRLVVEGARGLPGMDGASSADPYARVFWQGQQLSRTNVVRGSLEPKWNKEYTIGVPERGSTLRVVVYDRDALSKDDVIGEMELTLGGGSVAAGGAGVLVRSTEYPLGAPGEPGDAINADGLFGSVMLRVEEPGLKRRLTIARAAGLPNMDRGGTSDPYAVVSINGVEVGKTAIVRDTIDPVWDTSFEISIAPAGAEMLVQIFDFDDSSADDFMGQFACTVDGADASDGGSDDALALMAWGWHDLTTQKGQSAKGRIEMALETIKIEEDTDASAYQRASLPDELLPVQVKTSVLGEEWNCWARHTRNFEDEGDVRRPIVQVGFSVDPSSWEVEVDLSVLVESYHVEEMSIEQEHQYRSAIEASHTMAVAWKTRRRQNHRLAGRLYVLQLAEDWLKDRIARMPQDEVLRALFRSVDIDGDGELTRGELRDAPFGQRLVRHWVELDKDHDEGVQITEWLRFFCELETRTGWTKVHKLVTDLVWDAEVASILRNQAAEKALKQKTELAAAAAKEDAKASASAYFVGEEEKSARLAARGKDGFRPEAEKWMELMTKRDEAQAVAEEAKVVAEMAAAAVAEVATEVEKTEAMKAALDPLFVCEAAGASDWGDWLRQLRTQSERNTDKEQEQLDALGPSLAQFKQIVTTVLHLRGGLEALNLLSGGGGNPVRVKRQELKVDACLAAIASHASRSVRVDVAASRGRLEVLDGAREVLGQLLTIDRLLYVDTMARLIADATKEEEAAAVAVDDLAIALDARREAKRDAQRAQGAADWTRDAENAAFVQPGVHDKAAAEAELCATVWKDSRKWAVGSRTAKRRAAAARQRLRVLEKFVKEQPDREQVLQMLYTLQGDERGWTLESALEADLAGEHGEWKSELNAVEGTLQVLSKAFMEKAEAERMLRKLGEQRMREEAEAKARESSEGRSFAGAQQSALQASEERLRMLAEEAHVQPHRRIGDGDRVVLREDAHSKAGCLISGDVGRVLYHEQRSNRAKVESEQNGRIAWYSCERDLYFFGPLPPALIAEEKAKQELELAALKERQKREQDIQQFARKRSDELRRFDADMEQSERLEKEAAARKRARREVTTRVRGQLKAELTVCGEQITACDPSVARRTGLRRRLRVIDGCVSFVVRSLRQSIGCTLRALTTAS
jgi:hypothetical protein